MGRASLGCCIFFIFLATACGGCAGDAPTEHPYRLKSEYGVKDPEFRRTMGNLLGPPFIGGNKVVTLVNGEKIFPAMLEAIQSAKKTITFETYIYWKGQTGANFAAALSERARHGVKVHVIIDTIGSAKINHDDLKRMTDAGVQVVQYHPLRWYDIGWTKKLNNRTHRKLLVIDGQIGFTGGVGIADEWLGDADSPKHWRDTHYMITGPIVWQLQAAFADNWMKSTGRVLHGDEYLPELSETGSQWAQVFRSAPGGGAESMQLMFLLSIAGAQRTLRLSSAYFVPDRLTIDALVAARDRGVSVQIIVPGAKIDEKIVRPASRAQWGKLLQAGVEIYEYQPAMYHTKLMVVDDQWSSIGSANLDNRSFKLNDEANLNVLDASFAAEQVRQFEEDLTRSKRITYEAWRHRPIGERLFEGFALPWAWLL